jgi:hypothetical protein
MNSVKTHILSPSEFRYVLQSWGNLSQGIYCANIGLDGEGGNGNILFLGLSEIGLRQTVKRQ